MTDETIGLPYRFPRGYSSEIPIDALPSQLGRGVNEVCKIVIPKTRVEVTNVTNLTEYKEWKFGDFTDVFLFEKDHPNALRSLHRFGDEVFEVQIQGDREMRRRVWRWQESLGFDEAEAKRLEVENYDDANYYWMGQKRPAEGGQKSRA